MHQAGRPNIQAGSPSLVSTAPSVHSPWKAAGVRRRAGLKLEAALDHFGVAVDGLVVLDSGLSTGGFTDCLLQRGAAHVYGVDVGFGQVSQEK